MPDVPREPRTEAGRRCLVTPNRTAAPSVVEELRRLAAEATPGPWRDTTIGTASQRDAAGQAYEAVMARRLPDNPDVQFTDLSWVRTEGDDWLNVALVGNGRRGPENAALIAAAVNALPALLAVVEAAAEAIATHEDMGDGDPLSDLEDALLALQALGESR